MLLSSIESLRSAAHRYAEFWKIMMPEVEPPSERQFLLWSSMYSEDQVSRGITVTTKKLLSLRKENEVMSAEGAARYTSGVLRNLAKAT
jgi:hypothetical protein